MISQPPSYMFFRQARSANWTLDVSHLSSLTQIFRYPWRLVGGSSRLVFEHSVITRFNLKSMFQRKGFRKQQSQLYVNFNPRTIIFVRGHYLLILVWPTRRIEQKKSILFRPQQPSFRWVIIVCQ